MCRDSGYDETLGPLCSVKPPSAGVHRVSSDAMVTVPTHQKHILCWNMYRSHSLFPLWPLKTALTLTVSIELPSLNCTRHSESPICLPLQWKHSCELISKVATKHVQARMWTRLSHTGMEIVPKGRV